MTSQQYELEEPYVRVDVARASELIRSGARVIDVREPAEYASGHIPGARLVPLGALLADPHAYLDGHSDSGTNASAEPVLFVCAVGARSAVACEMAAAIGKTRIYNLEGGTQAWAATGMPIE